MTSTTSIRLCAAALLGAALALGQAQAATVTTLADFYGQNGTGPGPDGAYPEFGTLLRDAGGNLFGMTVAGGTNDAGTIFTIPRTPTGYGQATTLAAFNGTNGQGPEGGLIADAAGNLFGTTYGGGAGFGTVFEIPKIGGFYGPITLVATFDGTNGTAPFGGLLADAAGNLFGTTSRGGANDLGTIFEVPLTPGGYGTLTTLATFDGTNGATPYGALAADLAGNLFGTTSAGTDNAGTVFTLAKTPTGYGSLTTIGTFDGLNGDTPFGGPTLDASGNVFGTTTAGGPDGAGVVYMIANTPTGYASIVDLATFNGDNGQDPTGGLLLDIGGNIFGTTAGGGVDGGGTVFRIAHNRSGYGPLTTLASLNNASGTQPFGGLIADGQGVLYGTAESGGAGGYGTAFEVTGANYFTDISQVPEPPALLLLAFGLLGLAAARRRTPAWTPGLTRPAARSSWRGSEAGPLTGPQRKGTRCPR